MNQSHFVYAVGNKIITMTDHILEMVTNSSPEIIQKYVKNQLTNDPASLERIYNELVQYHNKPTIQVKKMERSASSKCVSSRFSAPTNKQDSLSHFKRTQTLLQNLKDKGFKRTDGNEQEGNEIFTNKKDKLVKPLITNSKIFISQPVMIDKMIDRYTLNSLFYNNRIEDVKLDIQNTIDKEMKEFLDRRNAVLQSLKNHQNTRIAKNPKYAWVCSKVNSASKNRIAYQQQPKKERRWQSTKKQIGSSQRIMDKCLWQLKKKVYKSVPQKNEFNLIQLREDSEQQEVNLAEVVVDADNVIEKLAREQFARYTHTYMKMMTDRTERDLKCKMNPYQKDLLRDEKKMRKIIDFSKK